MAGRKGDIMLVVSQDNAAHKLTVESVDESLGKIAPVLGYNAGEIAGKNFQQFLPHFIREQLEEYLEYSDDGKDLADVLSRCRNFGMLNRAGAPVNFKMRIQRDVALDARARFLILMRGQDKISEGVLNELALYRDIWDRDRLTDMPTADAFLKALKIVEQGIREGNTLASLAVIQIDNFDDLQDEMEDAALHGLVKEVALRCHQTFRDADVISYAGEGRFGVVLLEADATSALIPLQRLRASVANQLSLLHTTLSIAYIALQPEVKTEESLRQCEETLESMEELNHVALAS